MPRVAPASLLAVLFALSGCAETGDVLGGQECGNGVVEGTELCDTATPFGRCPDDWADCALCARGCESLRYEPNLRCTGPSGVFEYNDRAQTLLARYFDDEGNVDFELVQTFNAQYKRTMSRWMGPSTNEENRYTYDAASRLISGWYDGDLDGQPDQLWTIEYEQDGALLISRDNDADGVIDWLEYELRNEDGQLLEFWRDTDLETEGRSASGRTTYDENGRVLRSERDNNGDGVVDHIESWTRGEATTVWEIDNDADGIAEQRWIWRSDERGRILEQVGYDETTVPRRLQRRSTFTYDDEANTSAEEADHDGDGAIDFRATTQFDSDGAFTNLAADENADGSIDVEFSQSYDSAGNVVAFTDRRGSMSTTITTTFDEKNRPVSQQEVIDGVASPALDFTCNAALYDAMPLRLPGNGVVLSPALAGRR